MNRSVSAGSVSANIRRANTDDSRVAAFNPRTGRFDLHGETSRAARACVRLHPVIAYQSDDSRAIRSPPRFSVPFSDPREIEFWEEVDIVLSFHLSNLVFHSSLGRETIDSRLPFDNIAAI